ncbi:MAG: GAF domain-containing protein [Cyanobacteria bacterium P01_E01_bin.6]
MDSPQDHQATQTSRPLDYDTTVSSDDAQAQEMTIDEGEAAFTDMSTNGASVLPDAVPGWFQKLETHSHRLLAVLHPTTLAIEWANEPFSQRLTSIGCHDAHPEMTQLCRYHQLYRLLQGMHSEPLPPWRVLEEPLMISVDMPDHDTPRYVQVWVRSDTLMFNVPNRLDDILTPIRFNGLDRAAWLAVFNDGNQLDQWCKRLEGIFKSGAVSCQGQLLIEGVDITAQEQMRRITQLLVDQNSVLHQEKFEQVNAQMCTLFQADTTAMVCFQRQKVRLFMGNVSDDLNVAEYAFDDLRGGQLMEAIANQTIMIVPDLGDQCVTELGERLLTLGVRSLLLIPLMAEQITCGHHTQHPIGLVGILSRTPNRFDSVDQRRAEQLVPAFAAALATALRQMHQQRFINSIHPSVEWRFIQEAERRSLGMLPEPIVFQNVFPLYGISDIRGSSQERNRAIQADLVEQLTLGLAVVDAMAVVQSGTFVEQLRLDVLDKITELERNITVGAEVTISRYLSDRLETHFDHFIQGHPQVKTAVEAYRQACDPKQGGVYRARAHYDFLLGQINGRLRDTWENWQEKMQQVIPHYCDVEVTDGVDHMIYAGKAIAIHFSPFYLQSLRYEQLRAVCACARTAFDIQTEFDSTLDVTHLVLVQDSTVDIFHDEDTERLFDVRGTRDTRYEIVKKRIDKAMDANNHTRITQPGMLTVVYSTEQEEEEYREYLRYLVREGWIDSEIQTGTVEPLQGVSGLRFMRVSVLPNKSA